MLTLRFDAVTSFGLTLTPGRPPGKDDGTPAARAVASGARTAAINVAAAKPRDEKSLMVSTSSFSYTDRRNRLRRRAGSTRAKPAAGPAVGLLTPPSEPRMLPMSVRHAWRSLAPHPGLHPHRGAHSRHRHRRVGRDVRGRERRAAQAAAVRQPGSPGRRVARPAAGQRCTKRSRPRARTSRYKRLARTIENIGVYQEGVVNVGASRRIGRAAASRRRVHHRDARSRRCRSRRCSAARSPTPRIVRTDRTSS